MASSPTLFAQVEPGLGPRARNLLAAFPRVSGAAHELHLEGCGLFEPSDSRTLTEHLLAENEATFAESCHCATADAHSQIISTVLRAQRVAPPGFPTGRKVSEARQLRDRLVRRLDGPPRAMKLTLVGRLRPELGDEAGPLVDHLTEVLDTRLTAMQRDLDAWRNSPAARELMELRALARTRERFRKDEPLTALLEVNGPQGLLTPEELTAQGPDLPPASRARLMELLEDFGARTTSSARTLVSVNLSSYAPTGGFSAISGNTVYADALVRYQEAPDLWLLPTSLAPLVRWPQHPALATFRTVDLEDGDDRVLDTLVTLVKDARSGDGGVDLEDLLAVARALD